MKTQLHLDSVVPHGVGGPEVGSIDLIYFFLLNEFEQNAYSYIHINQIGDELNEVVLKDSRKIYINVRYPAYEDFENRSVQDKNSIRLDIIHTALMRIAEKEGKLDVKKLNVIKDKIIESDFNFDFVCKVYKHKKNKDLIVRVVVNPEMNRFNYFAVVMENLEIKHKVLIYQGLPVANYFNSFFAFGKWEKENVFILSGKDKIVETRISLKSGEVEFVNLTRYEKPPLFEMMRAGISQQEREEASKNWQHSLPPAFAAIIRNADN